MGLFAIFSEKLYELQKLSFWFITSGKSQSVSVYNTFIYRVGISPYINKYGYENKALREHLELVKQDSLRRIYKPRMQISSTIPISSLQPQNNYNREFVKLVMKILQV